MTLRSRLLLLLGIIVAVIAITLFFLTRPDVARLPLEAVTGPHPRITEPRVQNIPKITVAKPIGWRNGAMPTPAAGLAVAPFATGLDHPRNLLQLPNGDVLVAESNAPSTKASGLYETVAGWVKSYVGAGGVSPERIVLLRDRNGDGRADMRTVLLGGLHSPYGMALVGNRLFVGNNDALVAYPFTVGQTQITAPGEKIVSLPAGGEHWTRNIAASPDGKSIYVAVGSTSNIANNGIAAEDKRAAIWEVDVARHTMRLFATGLRNPVGLAWEPRSGALWASVNERDMLGPDLPPDYMTRVDFGAFYGWPYSYWGGYEDRRVEPRRQDLLQYTHRPEYALGPHTASLGLAFGSLGRFQQGAFIGQHGSWNRSPPSGYKVAFVAFNGTGLPNGPMQDVLTGFLDAKGRAQGRPVGVLIDRGGGLLVADDVGNAIWRVTAR